MNQVNSFEGQSTQTMASRQEFEYFTQLFMEREDAIILVEQLFQLMKAVQRHRGISMGMLGGNDDFQEEFVALQTQLERRLATLEAFAKTSNLLSAKDKENLSLAWTMIRSDWEGDKLNDNFELHSHFIEQLIAMIAVLAKKIETPLLATAGSEDAYGAFSQQRMRKQAEVLTFSCKALPSIIEEVARIRGTAVYSAAVDSLVGLDERKIRFWMSTLREHGEALIVTAEKLAEDYSSELPKLSSIKQNEIQLLKFLNTVEAALFLGKGGREEARRIFELATAIIEVYWAVISDSLDLVRLWHRQDLEAWMMLR